MGQSKERYMEEQERAEYNNSGVYEITPLRQMVISKSGAKAFHEKMSERCFNGEADPVMYMEFLQFMAKVKEEVDGGGTGKAKKEGDVALKALVMDEIRKHGKEMVSPRGVRFELAETGTKYDFSLTPSWVALDSTIKQLQEDKKQLEDMLKGIPAGKEIVDPETGELFYGPGKSSKSSFKVTISK